MAHVCVPDSLPYDSQYAFEATQLSQPQYSQTQNTQFQNSQVAPRLKYWALLIPVNPQHRILKIPWTKSSLQIGRGPPGPTHNDVVLQEKRVSNKHCRISLGIEGKNGQSSIGDDEPEVWIEDLRSSNGTFINGEKLKTRKLLRHGDEISLGHAGTLENHDVRYIFRSVGGKGTRYGTSEGKMEKVGEVYERYQFLGVLGSGTFAEVRKAVDVETGDLRAIKQIVKHRFASNPKTLELFRREVDITQTLQHENICRLIEAFEDPQHVCLVLEYVDGGDLLDHIMQYQNPNGGGFPEEYARGLTLQICRAMAYTHAKGVTHRDLKPENILLTKETPESPRQIKIADFGLAKMVHSGTMLVSMVGTPQYLAPEVVMQTKQKQGYENKVDSWSVGIVVYSMLTKALPFDEDEALPVDKRIKARFHQEADTALLRQLHASSTVISFIGALLAKEAEDRMSMAEALEHPWLAEPASQDSESQRYPLGGDSVFEIESFDDEDEDDNFMHDGGSYGTGNGDWSRPMTVSGTNLESGMGLNPHSSSEADDFSQPLQQLRLQSSLGRLTLPQNGSASRQNGLEHRQNSSPPSPPLTDEQIDMPTDPALPESDLERSITRDTRPVAQSQPQILDEKFGETSIPTPSESVKEQRLQPEKSDEAMLEDGVVADTSPSTATKRKARDLELFSSGSLSPPPTESIELSSPALAVKQAQDGQMEVGTPAPPPVSASDASTPQTRATSEVSGRRTTRSNAKTTGTSSPISTPTTRGRKSMRLG